MNDLIKDIMQQAKMYHADSNGNLDVVYEHIIRATIKKCIHEVSQYNSYSLHDDITPDLTVEQREEIAYIKGIDQGYNDAVQQIADGLRNIIGV